MSHEQKEHDCTPRLRFPEFERLFWKNGVLSKFIFIISPEYKLSQEKYLPMGNIPIIDQSKKYISGYTNDKKCIVSTINPLIVFGDHTCIVKLIKFPFAQGADGIKIFYGNKEILTEYIYFFINCKPVIMEEYKRHFSILKSKIIYYPESKIEQQKIADCLTSLDDLITAHEQKRDALTQHKKGLMQRLFPAEGETTPRWRFPEFREAGEWEMKKLNDCCRIITGGTPSRKNPSYWNGKIPWISSRHISDIHTVESCEYITEKGIKYSSTKVIPKDSIILVSRVSVGKYAKTVCDTAINQDITALLPYSINCNFLFFYVDIIAKMIKNSAAGTGVVGVSQDFFDNIVINAPTLPEQQKIADCLSSLDERIAAQEAKIAALREHKKGLMQQLFPRAL